MSATAKPNVIVILADNIGYGDWGCYGSRIHRTPVADRMAAEGARFTSFYSASGVCTPSRASLLTGCYPRRVGMHVGGKGTCVLMPVDPKGLDPAETTVARLLKSRGYATACIGKWHLGDQPPFLPTRHGFDRYFGIPYSDDMTAGPDRPGWPELPLMRQEEVVEAPVDRDFLTRRYTEEAVGFIRENRDRPFFLYLPHAMPGSTSRPFASPEFRRRSANGPYGDAIEEMDWSLGEILRALDEEAIAERTLVVWTSDNGAVEQDPPQGSNAPLKGWGYDTSEGSMRMPCLMRWPGRIPAGAVVRPVATMMDILPTCARLAGAEIPPERPIDGHDLSPLLFESGATGSPYDETGLFYYFIDQLQAVRAGRWKLYLPLDAKKISLSGAAAPAPAGLYDLEADVAEEREVSAGHPDIVARLAALAEAARREIGDCGRQGRGQRPAGWIDAPEPRLPRNGRTTG